MNERKPERATDRRIRFEPYRDEDGLAWHAILERPVYLDGFGASAQKAYHHLVSQLIDHLEAKS